MALEVDLLRGLCVAVSNFREGERGQGEEVRADVRAHSLQTVLLRWTSVWTFLLLEEESERRENVELAQELAKVISSGSEIWSSLWWKRERKVRGWRRERRR